MSVSTPSTACWSSDARITSAPLDPGRGRGQCARDPDPCNKVALVRGCGVNHHKADPEAARMALTTWLADARTSGIRALETFAAGLEQDGTAIRAALTTSWSSGQ